MIFTVEKSAPQYKFVTRNIISFEHFFSIILFLEMQNGSSHISREQTLPLDKNSKVSFFFVVAVEWRFGCVRKVYSFKFMYEITFQAAHKQSPLFAAVFAGDEKSVENLLAAGADRNLKDPKVWRIEFFKINCNVQCENFLLELSAWKHAIA